MCLGIWNTCADAKVGGKGHGHREAARTTINLYSEWRVERLLLEIGENVEYWNIQDWTH